MTSHIRVPRIVALLVTLLVPVTIAAIQRAQSGSIATEKIFEALAIGEGDTVCEVGAGDGELSIAAAKLVGPTGRSIRANLAKTA